MSLRYVDTSALVSCYLPDEPRHADLRASLLEGGTPVVTSELARLEMTSAAYAAHRAGRIDDPGPLLAVVDADCQVEGPITLLRLEPDPVTTEALALLARFPLRTLEALHLAVARTTATELAGGEPVVLVTRDERQAAAAHGLAMPVG